MLKPFSSGDIYYLGTNIISGEEVAIKLESVKAKHPQLEYKSENTNQRFTKRGNQVNVIDFGPAPHRKIHLSQANCRSHFFGPQTRTRPPVPLARLDFIIGIDSFEPWPMQTVWGREITSKLPLSGGSGSKSLAEPLLVGRPFNFISSCQYSFAYTGVYQLHHAANNEFTSQGLTVPPESASLFVPADFQTSAVRCNIQVCRLSQ
ncbi:hypothetical protein BYT27DRAFT_7252740 [Phlegmacium glaucopus]|nr:hypothetical protein BYT27DRAFT_7252740 [Phlegmacium glaucopus]